MIASILLIFVTVTILNYAVKRYLRRTISTKYSHSWHCLAENGEVIQYFYAMLFLKYYSRDNKFGIQNKSLVDLAYGEWIFNIKNKPQVARESNNYNKPEKIINEFEQLPI